MPRRKIPCPECGEPMAATSEKCRGCKPSYQRTAVHRLKMSNAVKGKPKPWLKGRKRPDHAEKMREWWTPERREKKRQEMLLLNPDARYHGLSCKGAKKLKQSLAHCEKCGHDGSQSRLDVHHRNGNKRDQSLSNLAVFCHRCHMQKHAEAGETGWDSYHRKRKMTQD